MARRPEQRPVNLNLTSMMDIVFQLIVFFLLVSNFSAAERPKLEPPELDRSQAREPSERNRVVVNVIPDGTSGRAQRVRVGIQDIAPGNYSLLTEMLTSEREKSADGGVEVDLRADRSIEYVHVQPVMTAITAAGISRINLVAYLEQK